MSNNKPGDDNAKVPDAEIQGVKAGERNRAATDAGVMPPPAGEPDASSDDPRRETVEKSGA